MRVALVLVLAACGDNGGAVAHDALTADARVCTGAPFSNPVTYATGQQPSGLALFDLDRDLHLDIVVANEADDTVSVLRNHGDGTLEPKLDAATDPGPAGIATWDMDMDGNVDVLVAASGSTNVTLLPGNGDGTFGPKLSIPVASAPSDVITDYYDADDLPDFAVTTNSTVEVMLNRGNHSFMARTAAATGGTDAVRAQLDDLPGRDLLVASSQSASISLLLGNGGGFFTARTIDVGCQPSHVDAVGGFCGQVAVLCSAANQVAFVDCDASGTLANVETMTVGGMPLGLAYIESYELAVSNLRASTVTLFESSLGSWRMTAELPAGDTPAELAHGDLDGDGMPDLVVANRASASVTVYLSCVP